MTPRLVLHVGTPKSGTTYLQQVLAANRERLAAAGVHVAGAERTDLVHAAMVVREDRRLAGLPAHAATAWDRLRAEARQARDDGARVVVVSYELFAGASREQAGRALADLAADGFEVDVVVTGRDLGRVAGSAWQERLKFALTTPFEEWTPPEASVHRADWGWRTLDPSGVAVRWSTGLPEARVHVVTVPRGGPPRALWDRFAAAAGLADVEVDVTAERVNQTLGPAAAEVLRRVNLLIEAPLDTAREQARWLRDLLAHDVLAGLDAAPFGGSEHLQAAATAQFERASARFADRGFTWHGELADLAPTRPSGRTPGATPVEEQLEVAVQAIWALLLRLRAASAPGVGAGAPPARPGGLARLLPGVRETVDRVAVLEAEIARLDAELEASRRLQHRVAMLTDVVGELLVPAAEQDADALVDLLRTYRTESL